MKQKPLCKFFTFRGMELLIDAALPRCHFSYFLGNHYAVCSLLLRIHTAGWSRVYYSLRAYAAPFSFSSMPGTGALKDHFSVHLPATTVDRKTPAALQILLESSWIASEVTRCRAFALEGRGIWHAASISLGQQVWGPLRARLDTRLALDVTEQVSCHLCAFGWAMQALFGSVRWPYLRLFRVWLVLLPARTCSLREGCF